MMSVVISVPALAKNALLGKRIAPSKSQRCAIYSLARWSFLSIVPPLIPLEVMKAITPPERTLSMDFAMK